MKVMQERDREFFAPLWRRVVLVAVVAIWSAWEWSNGESLWGTLTAGIAVYAIWAYLITFRPAADNQPKE